MKRKDHCLADRIKLNRVNGDTFWYYNYYVYVVWSKVPYLHAHINIPSLIYFYCSQLTNLIIDMTSLIWEMI